MIKSPIHWGVARVTAVVYFVQGALGIASISLPLFFKDQLGFSISTITTITSVSVFPWFLKIIYGAVSDAIPLWGLRRKPYLVICSAIGSLGWIMLAIMPHNIGWIIMSLSIANFGIAAIDVITDGLVVEHSEEASAQVYQSISWGSRSVGAFLSGFIGGFLAAKVPYTHVFLLTAALPFISLIAALSLHEGPHPARAGVVRSVISSVKHILNGDLKWFSIILLIAGLPTSFGTPFFFYMNKILGFDEIFLGVLQSMAWLGAIIGCFLFLKLFMKIELKKALYWAIWINVAQVLSALIIRGYASAFAVTVIGGILGYISLLPFMSGAAKLAHGTGVEGSLFAVLMSLYNISQAVSSFIGGYLFEWMGLVPLIVLTAVLGLSAFFVLPRIKKL